MNMARKICCPSCASRVTKKCDVFYEQGVSTVYGPNYVTTRMTSFAMRSAPPSPPVMAANDSESFSVVIALIGLGVMVATMLSRASAGYVFVGVVLFGLGLFAWLKGQLTPGKQESAAQHYQAQVQQYWADLELYKKLWICLDCGKIFIPPGNSSNRVINQEIAPAQTGGLLSHSTLPE